MKKNELVKLEKALKKVRNAEYRRKNAIDFFKNYGKHHIAWMNALVQKYKERGEYPFFPTIIADYYTNRRDKEVALLMTACIKWDSKTVFKQVRSMRSILGDSPYLWLRNQEYKVLGLPRNQEIKVEGYRRGHFWKVSQFAQRLYDICDSQEGFLPFEQVFNEINLPTFIDNLCSEFDFGEIGYRGRMIDMALRINNGIGKGLWSIPNGYKVFCPITPEMSKFAQIWLPEFKKQKSNRFSITYDEAVSMYGFYEDTDFLYAYLGWNELCKTNPTACGLYTAKYPAWYKIGAVKYPCEWREIQPNIEFT